MRTELYQHEMPLKEYVEKYVNIPEILQYCKACNGYGKKWSCPDFDFDPMEIWTKYDTILIYGKKIFLDDEEQKDWYQNLEKAKHQISAELFDKEKEVPNSVSLCAGSCTVCADGNCTKLQNEPCKYPDKLRYSIEALGGNVASTTQDVLGIEIKWAKDGSLPEYFTLIGGLLY